MRGPNLILADTMKAPGVVQRRSVLAGTLITPAQTGAQKSTPVSDPVLEREFSPNGASVRRRAYCADCHSGPLPEAQLDLTSFAKLSSVLEDLPHWTLLMERLNHREMPPGSEPQPPADLRRKVIDWVKAVRANELRKHAGDPGPVLARRLSNSEYNYTIRDLTGMDLKPTREFPVDRTNQSGFDNSGESLTM